MVLFSFSGPSEHIFEAVLNHGGDSIKLYVYLEIVTSELFGNVKV